MSDESSAVKTLAQESQDTPSLEEISSEDFAKKPITKYTRECPLLYGFCAQNKSTIDSNCIGDYNKFTGCHIFIELGLTAPPRTNSFYPINWEKDVVEQLREIKKAYEDLESNCTRQEKAIEAARQRNEQAQKNFRIFKAGFGPKP